MERASPLSYSVQRYNSIGELPGAYDDLFQSAACSFFLTRSWFEILENTARPERDRFFYLTVEAATQPLALMALRTPAGQLGSSLQGQNTGTGSIASLTNWYSCHYDLLISPAITDTDAVIRLLVSKLRKQLGKGAVIEFNYLDKRSATPGPLIRALRSMGLITLPYHHNLIRYEDLGHTSFDAFLKQRSSGLRKEFKRYQRRMEKNFQFEPVIYSDDSQLNKVLADYQQVYARSWKRPERYPLFIPELLRHGLAENRIRVGVLYLDDRPVAAEIYILFNGQAISYKGAYDADYRKQSPATVLQMSGFKHLIEVDGVSEINLGYGDEPYKKRWLSKSRDLTGILAFNPRSARGLWLLLKYMGKRVIRKLVYIRNSYSRSR
ncbi:MAG: GNAT family N-acetyltransferase [Thiogranum sp.]